MKFLNKLNVDNFRTVFRALYCLIVSMWVGAYIWNVTFSKSSDMSKYAEFILGFVLGTLMATLINFYFGGSDNVQKKYGDESFGSDSHAGNDSLSNESNEVIPGDDS